MARIRKRVGVDFDGPWFRKDPTLTFKDNAHGMMVQIADFGERDIKARVPVKTGALRDGIVGRASSKSGAKWNYRATVTATHVYPWKRHGTRGFGGRSQAEYHGGKVVRRVVTSALYDTRKFRKEMERELIKGLT